MTNQMRRGSITKPLLFLGDLERNQSSVREILGKAEEGNQLLRKHSQPQQRTWISCFCSVWDLDNLSTYFAELLKCSKLTQGNDYNAFWSRKWPLKEYHRRSRPNGDLAIIFFLTVSSPRTPLCVKQTLSSYTFSKEIISIIYPPFVFFPSF